jgi:hypothetical protein
MISNAVLPSPHSHQVGWPVAVMSLHVQRYKKGTRSARTRLPFATGRTLHPVGQISQTAAHRYMEKVDRCCGSTLSSPVWPELTPFGRFTRIAQGPTLGPTPFCDPLDSVA